MVQGGGEGGGGVERVGDWVGEGENDRWRTVNSDGLSTCLGLTTDAVGTISWQLYWQVSHWHPSTPLEESTHCANTHFIPQTVRILMFKSQLGESQDHLTQRGWNSSLVVCWVCCPA